MPDLWKLDPYLTVLVFLLLSTMLFYLIDRAGWQRKEKEMAIQKPE
jgi:hypothetical protein